MIRIIYLLESTRLPRYRYLDIYSRFTSTPSLLRRLSTSSTLDFRVLHSMNQLICGINSHRVCRFPYVIPSSQRRRYSTVLLVSVSPSPPPNPPFPLTSPLLLTHPPLSLSPFPAFDENLKKVSSRAAAVGAQVSSQAAAAHAQLKHKLEESGVREGFTRLTESLVEFEPHATTADDQPTTDDT